MTTPATAWPLENAVFSAAMLAHRLPWADAPARALGLDTLTREGAARSVLAHLRRTRSGRPVRLRTPFGSFLVPLTRSDTAGLLAHGQDAHALEPAVRLDAAGHRHGLHPHTALPPHAAPAAAALAGPLAEELDRVARARRDDGAVPWEVWRPGLLRAARRVVAGAAAAEDTLLSELLARAAAAAGGGSRGDRAAAVARRLAPYLADPDPDSVAGRCESGQALAHTLAVVSQAATATALQALALTAVGFPAAAAGPAGAVAAALDHFPPVAAAVYPVRSPFTWQELAIDAGTEILAAPSWLQDTAGAPSAGDHPATWDDGSATEAYRPSPLCGSPTACTASGFAVRVAEAIVRYFEETAPPVLLSPALTPDRMPHTLDPATLLIGVGPTGTTPPSAPGGSPAAYAALARAGAERLDEHARLLAACAADTGWNGDETGERFRTELLEHAERCARAASDVRAAARRLGG
ncbi:hypothetical protein [Streptomyces antimicrobicus]|uniref:Cytochrome P450 n=1 Tax=Streptomyces antimicrobicus TaxID=2883108 RepID=A0ABS8B8A2_9ACTN|nr:hypothetical protein [Streptomyces antimicrobicus]MCB5180846.1 hypothetical protein [Streptomyces antimicrobicus]